MKTLAAIIALGPWGWVAISAALVAVVILLASVFVIAPEHRAVVKAQAKIATAETSVAASVAPKIEAQVSAYNDKTAKVQQTRARNAKTIDALPSASTAIPDSDASAFVRGLCSYDSTSSDTACH